MLHAAAFCAGQPVDSLEQSAKFAQSQGAPPSRTQGETRLANDRLATAAATRSWPIPFFWQSFAQSLHSPLSEKSAIFLLYQLDSGGGIPLEICSKRCQPERGRLFFRQCDVCRVARPWAPAALPNRLCP